jgi:hypothetical protein
MAEDVDHVSSEIIHSVWVPAFAGTTILAGALG